MFLACVSHRIFIFLILVPVLDCNCYNQRKAVLHKTCSLISQLSLKQLVLNKTCSEEEVSVLNTHEWKYCLFTSFQSFKTAQPIHWSPSEFLFLTLCPILVSCLHPSFPSGPETGMPILDLACQKPFQDRVPRYHQLVSIILITDKKRCSAPEHDLPQHVRSARFYPVLTSYGMDAV